MDLTTIKELILVLIEDLLLLLWKMVLCFYHSDFMHGSAVVVTSDAGDATLYGHVDPTVEKGQEVSKGETIAKVKY